MSVRLWLLMADCWRCKTDRADPEQQRLAQELIDARQAAAGAKGNGAAAAIAAPPAAKAAPPPPPPAAPRPKANVPVAKLAPPLRLPTHVNLPRSVAVAPPPELEPKKPKWNFLSTLAILSCVAIAAFAIWLFLHRPNDRTQERAAAVPLAVKSVEKAEAADHRCQQRRN